MNRIKALLITAIALVALGQLPGCSSVIEPQKPAAAQLTSPALSVTAVPKTPRETSRQEASSVPEAAERQLPNEQSNVFFAQGSSTLALSERTKLKHLAQRLRADPDLIVTLTGYTNDEGSRSFNLAVADQRLGAVSAFLRKAGIPVQQIRSSIVEDEQPAAACRSYACRRSLRRVEFIFSSSK